METEWISLREASRRLGISPNTFPRVSAANAIRRRVLPGTFTKYHAGDVAALVASAVQINVRRKARATP